jgi:hypothetical protein
MKLQGAVMLRVKGEEILRRPGLLDKMKTWFGGTPDLRTGHLRSALEATAILDAARVGLRQLGIDNAVSLVIDDIVLFQDKAGRDDDLGDLFLAFHDHSSVLGAGFRLLRLAVEHQEAGLHLVVELQARTEHPAEEPAMRAVIAGRLKELEPRPGEDAEGYRRRVEPLTRDTALLEVHRRQFETFVQRVRDALQAAMPEASVEVARAEAQVERPSRRRAAAPPAPTARNYDPYLQYYPHPLDSMLSMMMWTSIFSMAMRPDVVVVDEHGDHVGHASEAEHAAADDDPGGVDDADHDGDSGMDEAGMDQGGDFDFGGDFDW